MIQRAFIMTQEFIAAERKPVNEEITNPNKPRGSAGRNEMNGTDMGEEKEEKLAAWEMLGSLLWFFMDALWLFESQWGVYIIVLPTVLANLMVFRYTEKSAPHLSITAAMNSIRAWCFASVPWP